MRTRRDAASSGVRLGDVDLGAQALAERRLHRQPAEAERPGTGGRQRSVAAAAAAGQSEAPCR